MQGEPHFLSTIFDYKLFSRTDLDTILPKFQQVQFAKNEFLLREGKISHDYWFVETGYIRSFVTDTAGNEISTNFYTTGEIVIDWPSFFVRTPTRENIQSLTESTCWRLDYPTFQQLFNTVEAFRESGRARLVRSYMTLNNQRISMISDPAKDRYKQLIAEKPHLLQNVSLKQIATFLGITDTSLSRIRKELASS